MSESSSISDVWDYAVTRGCKWSEEGVVLAPGSNTEPLDLTGATFSVVVKTAEDSSGTAAGTITAEIVSAEAGLVRFGQSVAQVDAMPVGTYWWAGTIALDGEEPEHYWHGMFDVADVVRV